MSDEDIDKAVKEAAAFEAQDKKRKEGIDAKNEADSMLFQTEKALGEVGDKIDASDRAAVEADCKALKEILEKVNMDDMTDAQIAEIKAAKEKLMGRYLPRCMSRLAKRHREQTRIWEQARTREQARLRKDSREMML